MNTSRSWFTRSRRLFPGGVNSPVRAFKAVGGSPMFIQSARGAWIRDVEGQSYIDMVGSWGPMILGHAHPRVTEAVKRALREGTSFGACSPREVELGERVQSAFPSMERMRFVSSGTEAIMSALRVARAATGRTKVLKFSGCYHGHVDVMLVKAGSGVATLGLSSSAGVPASWAKETIVVPYNDLQACEKAFERHGKQLAALIVEPVAANMGVVLPRSGFLEGLRRLTRRYGTVLIFDEVITGFRLSYGGAQRVYGIKPDLTCLGKIIGGGFPVGAYGGAKNLMKEVSPEGPVYQAGTLSGNPIAMAAGVATLTELNRRDFYPSLERRTGILEEGLREGVKRAGIAASITRKGSLLTLFFLGYPPKNYEEAGQADQARFGRYFRSMLRLGVSLPPSQFEAWFLSAAHDPTLLDRVIQAHQRSLNAIG